MKRLFLLPLVIASFCVNTLAQNTTQTVEQVTEAMSLTDDVDLHITGSQPFAEAGTIDIVNTDHAVVIMDALKPSLAKAYINHITINGEAAKDGTNCQLKLYDRGAILLPYGGSTFRPLTVYSEKDFGGESESNAFTEGNAGGFMKNVSNAWNNRIQSFRLKRGYMVTFALKKSGRGYSRCFIAAKGDLEVNLPELMAGRISSYRIFKWYDTSKVGVSDVSANTLAQLNAQTTFTWGPGQSMLPDAEMVPHRIDESWPTPAGCGAANYSPHLKTNNEPRNESDHGTWTMEQILANWEAMMATGMRLCTPSSWDGSDYWNATGFLADFLNEIDARGWRCDIIDLHGYWNEGAFTTTVNNWAQKFKRPVWITEWVWGASWSGGSGIFKEASNLDNPTAADLQLNKTVVARILDNLNSNNACERYFYWNGERNCSKLLRDGKLTPAGEYFATMKTNGPGYTGYGNYVPAAPPVNAITDLEATFNANRMQCNITWTNINGDLSTTVSLQRRITGQSWTTLQEWTGGDIEDKTSMSFVDNIEEAAAYEYRVVEKMYNNKTLTSNTAYNVLSTSEGTADVQFGTISAAKEEEVISFFAYPFEEEPVIVFGNPSYAAVYATENLMSVTMNSSRTAYNLFKMRYRLWESDADNTRTSKLSTTYIAAKPGRGKIGNLSYEAGRINDGNSMTCKREYTVTFSEPFASTPVVMVTPRVSNANITAVMWRIYDVTPEGFKIQLLKESNVSSTIAGPCNFIAIEKGRGSHGEGTIFNVGDKEVTFNSLSQNIELGYEVENPRIMVQLQTNNDDCAAQLRYTPPTNATTTTANSLDVRMIVDRSNNEKALSYSKTTDERAGYVIISDGMLDDDAITSTPTSVSNTSFTTLTGIRLDRPTRRGVYIVNGQKVIVK